MPADLFDLPYWLLLIVLVALASGAACGLHAVVHRTVAYDQLVEHNDVAGFMIAVVGVLYSVLIAFVVVVVWQQYNDADSNYGNEVSAAADIHTFAASLPADSRRAVRRLVDEYVAEMIGDEWPAMLSGHSSARATRTVATLVRSVSSFVPRDAVQADARTHLQVAAQRLYDLRNRRLSDNAETLPPVLWAALLLGAAITVGFGFLFGVQRFRIQLIMTASVAALIAIMFTLLIELDFPFRRDTALSTLRWLELQRYLHVVQDADAGRERAGPRRALAA